MSSQRAYKASLRAVVLSLLNRGYTDEQVLTIIDTITEVRNGNDLHCLTDRQVQNVLRGIEVCDTICAFGPGHQSTVICAVRGPHSHHRSLRGELEWSDEDITDQTHEYRGKTYRLAFSNEGWY